MRKHVIARKLLRGWRQGMASSEGSGLQGISSLYHLTFKSLHRAQAVFRFILTLLYGDGGPAEPTPVGRASSEPLRDVWI